MLSARLAVCGAALALGAVGCGGSEPRKTVSPGAGTPQAPSIRGNAESSRVVGSWADALRRGDVNGASRLFALPSRAFNGTGLIRLSTLADVRLFNRSLPCGARMIATEPGPDDYLIATFALTERPGPGRCGAAATSTARTAFRVSKGRITDWIRVEDLPAARGTEA